MDNKTIEQEFSDYILNRETNRKVVINSTFKDNYWYTKPVKIAPTREKTFDDCL
jgi:hypothetical protein